MKILVLNAGSSTLKFRLLELRDAQDGQPAVLVAGVVEKWGTSDAGLKIAGPAEAPRRMQVAVPSPAEAAEQAIELCRRHGIDALGHRVVHGGAHFVDPVRITPQVIEAIRQVSALAPLHNQNALQGIEAGARLLPDTPAGAVFDTAFHQTMPDIAARYAIPLELAESHALRRYGFHGISHRYVSGRLLQFMNTGPAGTRLITCHLGNGASICAVRDGRSIDTSMGLTPMEGLIMGTRSGDIDPGLLLHLMTALGMSAGEVNQLLNHRSGLLGLSGQSGDLRQVEQSAAAGNARAAMALEAYAYRVRKYIGAYAAALGGVDALAFCGGIGERSAAMRARICTNLEFLGLRLDASENARAAGDAPQRLSAPSSPVQLWVIPTDEELQIARELFGLFESNA